MKYLSLLFLAVFVSFSVSAFPLPDSSAPDFVATAVIPNKDDPAGKVVENFMLSELFGKKRIMLLTYPKNCTYICPTELIALNKKLKQFQDLNYEVLVLSTDEASMDKDPESSHQAWRKKSPKPGEGASATPMGIGNVGFTMISDTSRKLFRLTV